MTSRIGQLNTGSNAPGATAPRKPTPYGSTISPSWATAPPSFNDLESPTTYSTNPADLIYGAPVAQSSTNPYIIGDTGFIVPNSVAAPQSQQIATQAMVSDAWESLIQTSFAMSSKDLSFPGNWWPGLEVENVYAQFRQTGPAPFGGNDLDPNLRPEPWAAPASDVQFYDPATGQEDSVWVRYDPSRAAQQFFAMDNATREEYNTLMAQANMLNDGWEGLGDYSMEGAAAFAQALQAANYYGISAKQFLTRAVRMADRTKKGGGGGGRGPQVKLEVPDYETLLVDAENLLESRVGRKLDKWEYGIIADYMQKKYGEWAGAKKRAILGGNGTYEIPDPVKLTEGFVEDRYAAEIQRLQDTGDTHTTNQLLLDAATKGTRMVQG